MPDPTQISYDEFEEKLSRNLQIPRGLLRGMTGVESGGNPKAVSPVGAKGRFQVMPATFQDAKRRWKMEHLDPNNEFDNAYVGARYLREQYDASGGDFPTDRARWGAAVSRYHGGGTDKQGNVRAVDDIPGPRKGITTDKHVEKVMKRWAQVENESPDPHWDAQSQRYDWSRPALDWKAINQGYKANSPARPAQQKPGVYGLEGRAESQESALPAIRVDDAPTVKPAPQGSGAFLRGFDKLRGNAFENLTNDAIASAEAEKTRGQIATQQAIQRQRGTVDITKPQRSATMDRRLQENKPVVPRLADVAIQNNVRRPDVFGIEGRAEGPRTKPPVDRLERQRQQMEARDRQPYVDAAQNGILAPYLQEFQSYGWNTKPLVDNVAGALQSADRIINQPIDVQETARRAGAALQKLPGAFIQGAANLSDALGDSGLRVIPDAPRLSEPARTRVQQANRQIDAEMGVNPDAPASLATVATEGAISSLPYLATGAVGAGMRGVAAMGALQNTGQTYEDVRARGGAPDVALQTAVRSAPIGALEGLVGTEAALAKAGVSPGLVRQFGAALRAAPPDLAQEVTSQVLNNLNQDRPVLEGTVEAAIGSLATSGALGGGAVLGRGVQAMGARLPERGVNVQSASPVPQLSSVEALNQAQAENRQAQQQLRDWRTLTGLSEAAQQGTELGGQNQRLIDLAGQMGRQLGVDPATLVDVAGAPSMAEPDDSPQAIADALAARGVKDVEITINGVTARPSNARTAPKAPASADTEIASFLDAIAAENGIQLPNARTRNAPTAPATPAPAPALAAPVAQPVPQPVARPVSPIAQPVRGTTVPAQTPQTVSTNPPQNVVKSGDEQQQQDSRSIERNRGARALNVEADGAQNTPDTLGDLGGRVVQPELDNGRGAVASNVLGGNLRPAESKRVVSASRRDVEEVPLRETPEGSQASIRRPVEAGEIVDERAENQATDRAVRAAESRPDAVIPRQDELRDGNEADPQEGTATRASVRPDAQESVSRESDIYRTKEGAVSESVLAATQPRTRTQEIYDLDEHPSFADIDRRVAARGEKGTMGQFHRFGMQRGTSDTSLLANPELREMLNLPPMPKRPAEGEKWDAYSEASAHTADALAEVAGLSRSSQSDAKALAKVEEWLVAQGASDELYAAFVATKTLAGGTTANMKALLSDKRVAEPLAKVLADIDAGQKPNTKGLRAILNTVAGEINAKANPDEIITPGARSKFITNLNQGNLDGENAGTLARLARTIRSGEDARQAAAQPESEDTPTRPAEGAASTSGSAASAQPPQPATNEPVTADRASDTQQPGQSGESASAEQDGERVNEAVNRSVSAIPGQPATVGDFLYNGSTAEGGILKPRGAARNYNELGSWFTSSKEAADELYSKQGTKDLTIRSYAKPEGNLLEAPHQDFARLFGSNIPLVEQHLGKRAAAILRERLPDSVRRTELHRELNENGDFFKVGRSLKQTEMLGKELKQLDAADRVALSAMNNPAYVQAWQKMMQDAGYDGVVWRKSQIDAPRSVKEHDVYLIFHNQELKPISDAAPAQPAPEQPATPAQEAQQGAAKEPWQMTRDKYVDTFSNSTLTVKGDTPLSRISGNVPADILEAINSGNVPYADARRLIGILKSGNPRAVKANREAIQWLESRVPELGDWHRQLVKKALAEGKPVPAEVLADYPDLQPPPATPETAPMVKPETQPTKPGDARAQALYDKAKAALEKGTGDTGNPLSPAARKAYEDDLRRFGKQLGLPTEIVQKEAETVATKQPVDNAEPNDVQLTDEETRATTARRENKSVSVSPQASVRRISGTATEIHIPGESQPYRGKYEVRELGDLQPSHNPFTFERNAEYRFENDRDYGQMANRIGVESATQRGNFKPELVLSDDPTATNGAPIITPDGQVLGGNSRTMMLARVYRNHPTEAQAYRQLLQRKAAQFGINAQELARYDQPVLVRLIDTGDVNLQKAVSDLNIQPGKALSAAEQAAAMARNTPLASLEYLAGKLSQEGESGTIATAMEGRKGVEVVNRLIADGIFAKGERGRYIDEQGRVTEAAKKEVEALLLGRLVKDSKQLAQMAADTRNKLARIAAPLAKLAGSGWDIASSLPNALKAVEESKNQKLNLEQLNKRQDMFGEQIQYSPEELAIARTLKEYGQREVEKRFQRYASLKEEADQGAGLFGEPLTQKEAFDEIFKPAYGPTKSLGSGINPFEEARQIAGGVKAIAKGIKKLLNTKVDKNFNFQEWATETLQRVPVKFHKNSGFTMTEQQRTQFAADIKTVREAFERGDYATANKAKARVDKVVQDTLLETFSALRKVNLVGHVGTHVRNVGSNTISLVIDEVTQVPKVVADIALARLTGQRTAAFSTLLNRMVAKDSLSHGYDHFLRALREGMTDVEAEQMQVARRHKSGNVVIDAYINKQFDLLNAEDRMFYNAAYHRSLFERAKAQAMNEGLKSRRKVQARAKELYTNPPDDMALDAGYDADIVIFKRYNLTKEKSALTEGVQKARQVESQWGKFIVDMTVPFDRTPTNILVRLIEASPLGIGKAALEGAKLRRMIQAGVDAKLTAAQQRQLAQTIGRATVGSGLFLLGAALKQAGILTGAYGSDNEDKDKPAGSVKVGNNWYSIEGAGPQAGAMILGASVVGAYRAGKDNRDAGFQITKQIAKSTIGELPLFEGTTRMVEDFNRKGPSTMAGQMARQVLPVIGHGTIEDIAKQRDDKTRKPSGFLQGFKEGVPGMRESLPENRRRVASPFDPLRTQADQSPQLSDSTKQVLRANRIPFNNPQRYESEDKTRREALADWEARSKRVAEMLDVHVPRLVQSDLYKNASPEIQKKLLTSLKEHISDFKDGLANKKNPNLALISPEALYRSAIRGTQSRNKQDARRLVDNLSVPR